MSGDDAHAETIRTFGLGDEDIAAWRASGLGDAEFVDWLTDRVARRPSGSRAREVYGAEDVHDWARRAILDSLARRTISNAPPPTTRRATAAFRR